MNENKKIETVLELDKNLNPYIGSGCKTTSIRLGHRYFAQRIKIGGYPAIVNSYKHFILMTVPLWVLQGEGFKSIFDMLIKLKKYYPDINLASPVTVIEFRLEVVEEGSTKKFRPNANLPESL